MLVLSTWDLGYLEKHGQLFHDAIKKGLSDPDAEARSSARRAFAGFRDQFPTLADTLLATLEPTKKKALMVQTSALLSGHLWFYHSHPYNRAT